MLTKHKSVYETWRWEWEPGRCALSLLTLLKLYFVVYFKSTFIVEKGECMVVFACVCVFVFVVSLCICKFSCACAHIYGYMKLTSTVFKVRHFQNYISLWWFILYEWWKCDKSSHWKVIIRGRMSFLYNWTFIKV